MTTQENSKQARARARAAAQLNADRSANEVELLQTEIAAVEAFVTDPAPVAVETTPVVAAAPLAAVRPGSTWTPTPTPQPWLAARSA